MADNTIRWLVHQNAVPGNIRVLFGVSSVGLGHVKRSLSIAKEMERLDGRVSAVFLCASPALDYLEAAGARLAPESHRLLSLSQAFEHHSVGGFVNGVAAIREAYGLAKQNYSLIADSLGHFDLLVQDEFLETLLAHRWDSHPRLPSSRAAITDFVDIAAGPGRFNPLALLISWYAERMFREALLRNQLRIFADTLESVPPRLRGWVQHNFLVTGPIVQPDTATAQELRRTLLGSSGKTRIVCFTVGGTAIGKHLLDLAWENRKMLSESLDALLVFITGPRIDPKRYVGDGCVVALGMVTDATSHFEASDCVVTQGGASTLNELEVLGKPTVCVPIGGHWEQERNAQRFSRRSNFVVVSPDRLSPGSLLFAINRAMGAPPSGRKQVDGATLAARAILGLLESKA